MNGRPSESVLNEEEQHQGHVLKQNVNVTVLMPF